VKPAAWIAGLAGVAGSLAADVSIEGALTLTLLVPVAAAPFALAVQRRRLWPLVAAIAVVWLVLATRRWVAPLL